ncbi:MAG: hypothetical protein AB8H79_02015 [Myxococcota bacterium]
MPLLLPIAQTWDGTPIDLHAPYLVALSWREDHLIIKVSAPYFSDPAPAAPVGSTWKLWTHEVVELFLVGTGDPVPYVEIELSPHGHHLALALQGVRNIVDRQVPLRVRSHIDGRRWTGEAAIHRDALPPGVEPGATVRLNGAAIHGVGEARTYLSTAALGGDHPDFHRIDAFETYRLPR